MNAERLTEITGRYPDLQVAVIGDFCLDRYWEIDPDKAETSIETGLSVHNVVHARCQPGAAGTILNNLVALGIGRLFPVGFHGKDGEGFELRRALEASKRTDMGYFVETDDRQTFTYTKPLVVELGKAPRELNRFDMKNWSPTPEPIQAALQDAVEALAPQVDGFVLLDQVDIAETGVVTRGLLEAIRQVMLDYPRLWVIGDSRQGLSRFPPMPFKMNRDELARLFGEEERLSTESVQIQARELASKTGCPVFVTLADEGMVGANPANDPVHLPAPPVYGEIDIVGAGDAVTANLIAALAAGASTSEALELAQVAASIVIHQLGTTGTATVPQLHERFTNPPSPSPWPW